MFMLGNIVQNGGTLTTDLSIIAFQGNYALHTIALLAAFMASMIRKFAQQVLPEFSGGDPTKQQEKAAHVVYYLLELKFMDRVMFWLQMLAVLVSPAGLVALYEMNYPGEEMLFLYISIFVVEGIVFLLTFVAYNHCYKIHQVLYATGITTSAWPGSNL
jgi:hypothetical protein